MEPLTHKRCLPCEGMVAPFDHFKINEHLAQLKNWQASSDEKSISKSFSFKNYYQTIAFVNSLAWMSHLENHHADLEVSFNRCIVHYSTHAIDGLSINDFICAAKVDSLFQPYEEKNHARS